MLLKSLVIFLLSSSVTTYYEMQVMTSEKLNSGHLGILHPSIHWQQSHLTFEREQFMCTHLMPVCLPYAQQADDCSQLCGYSSIHLTGCGQEANDMLKGDLLCRCLSQSEQGIGKHKQACYFSQSHYYLHRVHLPYVKGHCKYCCEMAQRMSPFSKVPVAMDNRKPFLRNVMHVSQIIQLSCWFNSLRKRNAFHYIPGQAT